jgi:uncharacterized membrane protein YfcA
MIELPLYLAIGVACGFLAGLLGIGGGLVAVPALLAVFAAQDFPDSVALPLAIVRAHHARAAVDWGVLCRVAPGVATGACVGAALAGSVPSKALKAIFALYAALVATQMLCGRGACGMRSLPGRFGLLGAGGLIGGVSALVGVGGAVLSVPYFTWCRVPVRTAIGTASAIGFPIAVAGAVGYVVSGLQVSALPPLAIGFVYLPALAGIVATSFVPAPLGACLSHKLPVEALRRAFALVLYVVAAKMLPAFI